MTADYFPFPRELPGHAGTRITDEVRGINRVVCDITSKIPWHDQMRVSLNWFCDSRIAITMFAPEIPLLNGSLLLYISLRKKCQESDHVQNLAQRETSELSQSA